jgi:hypothetical protein
MACSGITLLLTRNELEKIWKKVVMAYSSIYLEGLREPMKAFRLRFEPRAS